MIEQNKPLWVQILTIAAPMIISMTGFVFMQFIDSLFLSWYSSAAIAAVVPAGMASWLLISPFNGTASYTSTLVAHYTGAGREQRAFSATWHGLYFTIGASIIVALLGFIAEPLFTWAGHDPAVRVLEIEYFKIICWGSFVSIASGAISGYFMGKGNTKVVMLANFSGFAMNALLDYIFIFGKWGFPEMGITGAAIATVLAQLCVLTVLATVFLRERYKGRAPLNCIAFDRDLFGRLVRFGFPNGLRYGFEMLAWTVFIFFLGRIGPVEQAASNIAFRLNGFAFFPIVGLGYAIGIFVGQSQGSKNPEMSSRVTTTGFLLAEIWMIFMAIIFILFPQQLYNLFDGGTHASEFSEIISQGVIILRFVAVYSLLDACNIIFISSLQAAGDTRWTLMMSVIAHVVFLSALAAIDYFRPALWLEWLAASFFVWSVALVWFFRFRSGVWKNIQVIEDEWDDEHDKEYCEQGQQPA
ncbi:MAG TPA: MATE family efflux transporter [Chitinispirillaceae bacterium]|nr:MATE family efflux transporter [Chitinispirillaceae bacterium]